MNNRKRLLNKVNPYKQVKHYYLKKGAKIRHKTGIHTSFGEVISVYKQNKRWYIGNLAEVHGMLMINCYFDKKDCIPTSPIEIKKAFLKHPYHSESDYYAWFGDEAVRNKNGRRYFYQKEPSVLIKADDIPNALDVFMNDVSDDVSECYLKEISKQEAWDIYKNTEDEDGRKIDNYELIKTLESYGNELLACSRELI